MPFRPGTSGRASIFFGGGTGIQCPRPFFPPWEATTTARRVANPSPPPAELEDVFQLEGLITTLATSFISLAAGEVDSAICRSLGMLG